MESSGRPSHANPASGRRRGWWLTPRRARNLTAILAAFVFMWAPVLDTRPDDSWNGRGDAMLSALQRADLIAIMGDGPRLFAKGEDSPTQSPESPQAPSTTDSTGSGDAASGSAKVSGSGSSGSGFGGARSDGSGSNGSGTGDSGSGSSGSGFGGSGSDGSGSNGSGNGGSGSNGSGNGGSGSNGSGNGGSGPGGTGGSGPGGTGAQVPSVLAVHNGDIVVTKPGTVLSGMEIRGRVIVKANNVTIRDCKVVGGPALTSVGALVQSWWGNTGLVVENSVVSARNPSVYVDGISGANFTASNVTVSNVVDTVKVLGSNVTVRDSVLGPDYHQSVDPLQANGPTHDDNIQIEGGSNILIEGNTMSGAQNTAIMVTQNASKTQSLTIRNNRLSGGACTVNMDEKGKGPMGNVAIYRNVFGPEKTGKSVCPMYLPNSTAQTAQIFSNVFTSGAAASPVVF